MARTCPGVDFTRINGSQSGTSAHGDAAVDVKLKADLQAAQAIAQYLSLT